MEAKTLELKSSKKCSKKEISDYFLDIILNIKGDSAKIDESANNVFMMMNDYEKMHLINALNNINNHM